MFENSKIVRINTFANENIEILLGVNVLGPKYIPILAFSVRGLFDG
jgi:hypothetical protein